MLGPVLDVVASLTACHALSIGVTLFLKWFLHQWHSSGYPFATTLTLVNMLVRWLVASVVLKTHKHSSISPLPRRDYWTLVVPIAMSSALGVLTSYVAVYYITVTLSTVARSTQNVWTLVLSICIGHQRFSRATVAAVALISLGVSLSALHSTQFHLGGFVLMLVSAILQTLQWVLTQILLKRLDPTASNPVLTVMSVTAAPSALCLLPFAILFEGRDLVTSAFLHEPLWLLESTAWVLVSGALACAFAFSKVFLIHQTSALTLGVSGSLRDVLQILVAVVCFGDHISPMNGVGLVAVVVGVLLYTLLQHHSHAQASPVEAMAKDNAEVEVLDLEGCDTDSLLGVKDDDDTTD